MIHRFTLVQLVCIVCIVVLCAITLSPNSTLRLSFPLFIALLIPVRFLVGRVFEAKFLVSLDAAETPNEEETHWAG